MDESIDEFFDRCIDSVFRNGKYAEMYNMITSHQEDCDVIFDKLCGWLSDKNEFFENDYPYSHDELIFINRFHFYRSFTIRAGALKGKIEKLCLMRVLELSGEMALSDDEREEKFSRWVKLIKECKYVLNYMIIEHEYFASYFEKHHMEGVFE